MLILFAREQYLKEAETTAVVAELAEQSRMIHSFRKTLTL